MNPAAPRPGVGRRRHTAPTPTEARGGKPKPEPEPKPELEPGDVVALRHGDVEARRHDAGAHAHGLAELIAVELHELRLGRTDLELGTAGVAHGVVAGAQRQHAPPGAELAQEAIVPRDAAPDEQP